MWVLSWITAHLRLLLISVKTYPKKVSLMHNLYFKYISWSIIILKHCLYLRFNQLNVNWNHPLLIIKDCFQIRLSLLIENNDVTCGFNKSQDYLHQLCKDNQGKILFEEYLLELPSFSEILILPSKVDSISDTELQEKFKDIDLNGFSTLIQEDIDSDLGDSKPKFPMKC